MTETVSTLRTYIVCCMRLAYPRTCWYHYLTKAGLNHTTCFIFVAVYSILQIALNASMHSKAWELIQLAVTMREVKDVQRFTNNIVLLEQMR